MKQIVHRIKYNCLLVISSSLEKLRLASRSSGPQGTFDGEEFVFYRSFFNNSNASLDVLDIGANTGLWAIDFLQAVSAGEVVIHAIEPIPEFIQIINAKGDPRILTHNYAIGKDLGEIKIAKIGQGGTSFPNTDNSYPEARKDIHWHTVPSISGDSLVTELGIKPDLIKIDTDGFDFTILKSLQKTLVLFRPVVQFEFTFRFAKKAKYSLCDVIDYLDLQNYRSFVLTSEGNLRQVIFPRLEVLNHQTKNFIALPN
jgi:FkbM family methyltransferase